MKKQDFDRREIARITGLIVIVVILVAFVLDNSHSVRVGFVFADREPRLIWVLIITALLGAAADRLIRWRRHP
jgi:uncharacterized integral membrane protein